MVTCPACRRSLALADSNGRHVASEAHYPHLDASGTLVCSLPARTVSRAGPGAARAASQRERTQSPES